MVVCGQQKSNQRWLWYAVDHATNTVLAYVFGKRTDEGNDPLFLVILRSDMFTDSIALVV